MRGWLAVGVALLAATSGMAPPSQHATAATGLNVAVGDGAVVEGDVGTRTIRFPFTLSLPSTSSVDVTYTIASTNATVGSSCTAGVDFRSTSTARIVHFAVGRSGRTGVVKFVAVPTCGDMASEGPESFVITILSATGGAAIAKASGTGRIHDDEPLAGIRVSVGDAAIVEGDEAQRKLQFTVSLSDPASITVGVDYRIVAVTSTGGFGGGGTPPPDVDVVDRFEATRRITFAPGRMAKTISVSVASDTMSEGTETFLLELSNPSTNLFLGRATGIGSIIDDDVARRPLMGTAVRYTALSQDLPYAEIAGARFDVLAPENELKWDIIEPQRGVFNFAVADAMVEFAEQHGERVFGQALAWWFQNPAWLTNGNFTSSELESILANHATTLVGRYRGRISDWVVVNEAIDDNGQLRANVWSNGIGARYIDLAFDAARAADPDANLYINDYGVEMPGPKADALYALVSGLVSRGVPIDGVGLQMHVGLGEVTSAGLAGQIQRYQNLGLDVSITELDVRLALPADSTELAAQADVYRLVRDVCVAAPNCTAIITWGFSDRYSWIPSFFAGMGAALPWDANLQPKPAQAELEPFLRG